MPSSSQGAGPSSAAPANDKGKEAQKAPATQGEEASAPDTTAAPASTAGDDKKAPVTRFEDEFFIGYLFELPKRPAVMPSSSQGAGPSTAAPTDTKGKGKKKANAATCEEGSDSDATIGPATAPREATQVPAAAREDPGNQDLVEMVKDMNAGLDRLIQGPLATMKRECDLMDAIIAKPRTEEAKHDALLSAALRSKIADAERQIAEHDAKEERRREHAIMEAMMAAPGAEEAKRQALMAAALRMKIAQTEHQVAEKEAKEARAKVKREAMEATAKARFGGQAEGYTERLIDELLDEWTEEFTQEVAEDEAEDAKGLEAKRRKAKAKRERAKAKKTRDRAEAGGSAGGERVGEGSGQAGGDSKDEGGADAEDRENQET